MAPGYGADLNITITLITLTLVFSYILHASVNSAMPFIPTRLERAAPAAARAQRATGPVYWLERRVPMPTGREKASGLMAHTWSLDANGDTVIGRALDRPSALFGCILPAIVTWLTNSCRLVGKWDTRINGQLM